MSDNRFNADFINAFVLSTVEVLEATAKIKAKRGELKLKSSLTPSYEIGIFASINGPVEGIVVFSMSESTAKLLASLMLLGIHIEDLDEMAKSALNEMFIVTIDKAYKKLLKIGFNCKISSPNFIYNGNKDVLSNLGFAISLPLIFHSGQIEMNVGLINKA